MRCMNCGYDHGQDFAFCPHCGAHAGVGMPPPPTPMHPEAMRVLNALRDHKFLAICILMTVSAATNFSVISVLYCIFLWLVFAKSKKGLVDAGCLRNVSGTVFAAYVINYVLAVLLLVVGIIFGVAIGLLTADPTVLNEILAGFGDLGAGFHWIANLVLSLSGGLVMGIFAVLAVLSFLLNVLMFRPIHRFAKSVYQTPKGMMIDVKVIDRAATWLIVAGAIDGASALGSLASAEVTAAIGAGCMAAAAILAATLVNKYFKNYSA